VHRREENPGTDVKGKKKRVRKDRRITPVFPNRNGKMTMAATTARSASPIGVTLLLIVLINCAAVATAGSFGGSPASAVRQSLSSVFSHRREPVQLDGRLQGRVASSILLPRGGGYDSDFDSDDESDDFDDDDFDFDDFDELGMEATDDFGEDNTLTNLAEAYRKTPPLTKAYLTASFGAAALGYATNRDDFPSLLQLNWPAVFTKLQIWRPFTAFLNFGPMGLGYLMTAHFVWTYMSTLERLNHARPYDFWLMMLFGSVTMVAGYAGLGLSPRFFGHNLSTFLVYVWSRYS